MEEAIELLSLFSKECKEDGKEIKIQLKDALRELDQADTKIKDQERTLLKLRRDYQERDTSLRVTNAHYSKLNPKGQKSQEQALDDEINENRRLVKTKEAAQ